MLPLPEAPRTPAHDCLGSGASEVLLISQAERGGAPSLATAGPPPQAASNLPLATQLNAGCRGKCVLVTAAIADNKTHTFKRKVQKYFSAYRVALMQPVCTKFQPLATWAEAWQAIAGVSTWVMTTVRQGYALQFARRPPRFRNVLTTTVRSEDAQVLRAEVMNLL